MTHAHSGYEREADPARGLPSGIGSVSGLLARAAVDALTQQICVAGVAGILLNKVDHDVARLDLSAVDVDRRVQVQVGVDIPCMCDLTAPGVSRFGDDLVAGHGLVEVQVWVRLGAVELRQLDLSFKGSARPGVLDPSEVADHAQQRHRRRRARASGELLGGPAGGCE